MSVEYGPFKIRHAEYLEGQYHHGLSDTDIHGYSAYLKGPRFRRLIACFGVASGDVVGEMFKDFEAPALAFFTHRPDGPILPMTFCKKAREFLKEARDRSFGTLVTFPDTRFRNAENWIKWLGFKETDHLDSLNRKVFVCPH